MRERKLERENIERYRERNKVREKGKERVREDKSDHKIERARVINLEREREQEGDEERKGDGKFEREIERGIDHKRRIEIKLENGDGEGGVKNRRVGLMKREHAVIGNTHLRIKTISKLTENMIYLQIN